MALHALPLLFLTPFRRFCGYSVLIVPRRRGRTSAIRPMSGGSASRVRQFVTARHLRAPRAPRRHLPRTASALFTVVATAMVVVALDVGLLGPRSSGRALEQVNPVTTKSS